MDAKAERLAELFKAACEQPDHTRFLDEHCRADPELRAELKSLLEHHERTNGFMETPALHLAAESLSETDDGRVGEIIGHYEVLSLIGSGGMGNVYLARDRDLGRKVALKIIRRGMDSEDIIRRFRQEERLLASLNHPNIAQLYGGGVTSDGVPYFAMERVDGTRIDQYCDERQLTIRQRLELFRKVCGAVQYAHQRLVVHRDIKPSNIVVTAEGEPKLLDFGIGKLLQGDDSSPEFTITIARILTPEYASPEHVRGEPVTTASDTYSLGILLYELLTGAKPYRLTSSRPAALERAITGTEPVRPSAAVRNQKSEIGNQKSLRGDLDNIVLMAIRKEPERRYASAGQFSEDIRRHLESLPVRARRDTLSYRSSKFVRRHRAGVAAAVIVLLSLVGGLIGTAWEAHMARAERDRATGQQRKTERINQFLQMMLSSSSQSVFSVSPIPNRRDVTVNQMLDEIAPRIDKELADEPDIRGRVLRTIGSAYASQGKYDSAEKYLRAALDAQTSLRGQSSNEAAAIMVELGVLSYREGKLDDSVRLLEKAVASYRKEQQAKAPQFNPGQLADALDHLGTAKFLKGDVKSARPLLNEALQLALDPIVRTREPAVSAVINMNVGGCLVLAGDAAKGEPLLREGTVELRKISAEPRWEYGVAVTMLGVAALNKNDLEEAEKYLAEGEQIYRQTLGDINPYLRYNLDRFAATLLAKSEVKRAEEKAQVSVMIASKIPGQNKVARASSLWTLGDVLSKQARWREAEESYRQSLTLCQPPNAQIYSVVVPVKTHLSRALLAQNRGAEAERIASEAQTEARQNLGLDNPLTKAASENLAVIETRVSR